MMRTTSVLVVLGGLLVAATTAQRRPGYVPNPVIYPQVNRQFLTENEDSDTENRFGGDLPSSSPGQSVPEGVDEDIYKTVASWPPEKQPFWYLNRKRFMNQ